MKDLPPPALGAECEEWRPIPGYKGRYEVSNHGRVRSLRRWRRSGGWLKPRVLRHATDATSYPAITLFGPAGDRKYRIHELVLFAFTGPRPAGNQACHADGDKQNNTTTNLRWDTPTGNCRDSRRNGTWLHGEGAPRAKLTLRQVRYVRAGLASGAEQCVLAAELGVTRGAIHKIAKGKNWRDDV